MLSRYAPKLRRLLFELGCRGVLQTAPIVPSGDVSVALFTQMYHAGVLMGLVALKSFAARVPVGGFFVLNDGSLTEQDRAILQRHLIGVTIIDIDTVNNGVCPARGCWERLLSIADLSNDHYVIQLDIDTLTQGDLPEVREHIAAGRSFAIGTWDRQELETMTYRMHEARTAMGRSGERAHIQVAAEAAFDAISGYEKMKYVRGCAGFSGFAKGTLSRDHVERISREMQAVLGERWREWGSEQVVSNIMVANAPDAAVLPHPKYCDCTRITAGETVFVHFIGSCRFKDGRYAREARRAIRQFHRDTQESST